MKKLFILAATAIIMNACTKPIETKSVTFNAVTYEAFKDEPTVTDLWLFDYWNGQLFQSLHQQSTDSDWRQPTLSMPYGNHTICIVASAGTSPQYDEECLWFTNVADTYWSRTELDIDNNTSTVTIQMNRVVTKFRFTITDAIKEGTTSFRYLPDRWYTGINYITGEPCRQCFEVSVPCPIEFVGTNNTTFELLGFSSNDEWYTCFTLQALNGNDVISSVTPSNPVGFKANRSTHCFGKLYSTNASLPIEFADEWETEVNEGW